MKVAITGASGHIGNALCRELLNRGHHIKALLYTDVDDLKKPGIELINGNILDKDSLVELCRDVDFVFHLAAKISIDRKEQSLVYKTNVEGTRNIVDVCKSLKVKRLIHFSTIHTFDPFPLDEVLNESRPQLSHTKMIYEQSKLEGENIVLDAVKNGLDAIILHPTAVFGPFDFKPSLTGQALMKIYNNHIPMLVPGGYDWVDVRDVANGAVEACFKGKKGEKYILSGHWRSLQELSALIGSITQRKTPQYTVPFWMARMGIPFISAYASIKNEHPLYTTDMLDILKTSHRQISSSKAQKELGYAPRPIEESISDVFSWYKQQGMLV